MSSKSTASHSPSWRQGAELLNLDPAALIEGKCGTPRLAKDEDYASAILRAWRDDLESRTGDLLSVSSPFTYESEGDGSSLHGHIYRPRPPLTGDSSARDSVPGIILFHTAAGPQDIFLRWKADSLASDREVFGDKGCVVLIADIIGDATGWAWHDRGRYDAVRGSVLVPDGDGERKELAGRVLAAVRALKAQPGVDPGRIGAVGFCLGGHPVLELARTGDPSVRAMATFHGVFDGAGELSSIGRRRDMDSAADAGRRVLVCTGGDDPFVPEQDLDAAARAFADSGCQCRVMRLGGARHGFTNPAQDYNPNLAFGYNEKACAEGWSATLLLLRSAVK